jgi:signal transduction histidine kinase
MATVAPPFQRRHRARFDALRSQIFAEMGHAAARWRLMWVIPFNLFVIALLALRGDSRTRVLIQVGAAAVAFVGFAVRARVVRTTQHEGIGHKVVGLTCWVVGIANTGGLGSPLLVTGLPIIVAASVHPMRARARLFFFLFFAVAFVGLALASHTPVGRLVTPLAPVDGYSSAEYVFIALVALLFTGASVHFMGQSLSNLYERVALELAERREEICSENEDRTRALEGIAARLAHEVKNPLAAIKGLSTHMARNATDPKTAERLSIVAAEADRLQAIVDGFLSFSRGLDDLVVAPVVPYALASELTVLLETRAAESGVTLEVKGSAELVLNADGRKLRQALLNLVLNAMQASPSGEKVTVEIAKCCGGAGCIKVIDRGAGMTADVLERIRKPYFTTREGGSGLGIAVARGLVEQHGGQLHYDSRPGKGTTVTLDVPACAMAAAMARKLPNPCAAAQAARGALHDALGGKLGEPGASAGAATKVTTA